MPTTQHRLTAHGVLVVYKYGQHFRDMLAKCWKLLVLIQLTKMNTTPKSRNALNIGELVRSTEQAPRKNTSQTVKVLKPSCY